MSDSPSASPMVTLVVPPGAEQYPIAEGTTAFVPYRADHRNPMSPWLVDMPSATAGRFMHNGGFARYEMADGQMQVPDGHAVMRHHSDPAAQISSAVARMGEFVLIPLHMVEEALSHGFATHSGPVPEAGKRAGDDEGAAEPTADQPMSDNPDGDKKAAKPKA